MLLRALLRRVLPFPCRSLRHRRGRAGKVPEYHLLHVGHTGRMLTLLSHLLSVPPEGVTKAVATPYLVAKAVVDESELLRDLEEESILAGRQSLGATGNRDHWLGRGRRSSSTVWTSPWRGRHRGGAGGALDVNRLRGLRRRACDGIDVDGLRRLFRLVDVDRGGATSGRVGQRDE